MSGSRKYKEDGRYKKMVKQGRKNGEKCSCEREDMRSRGVEGSNEIFEYVWSLSENKMFIESMTDCVTPAE